MTTLSTISEAWHQFGCSELRKFVINSELAGMALREIHLGHLGTGKETRQSGHLPTIYIPTHLSPEEFSAVNLTTTSETPDTIVVFLAAPQGHLNLSLHGPGHRLAFMTSRRVEIDARLFGPSSFVIGENTFCAGMRAVISKSIVEIGADSLLSDEILFQAGDQHGILDVGSRRYINDRQSRLRVGRHVWIGRRAVVCNRADIGEGSVLGTAAVAGGNIPPLSVAVGNPARVVRRGVSWSLNEDSLAAHETAFLDSMLSPRATKPNNGSVVHRVLKRLSRA
jgi:acetyltransferase-like isoleucine patch superfamily enzyme